MTAKDKQTAGDVTYMWNSKKKKKKGYRPTYLQNRNRLKDWGRKVGGGGGGGEGGTGGGGLGLARAH